MDVAEMKVPGKTRVAGTKGEVAKGAALAKVCIDYATKRMAAEEKEQGKLLAIVKSIGALDHKAHVEFRSQLTSELNLLKEIRNSVGTTRAQTAGYSFNSFEVLVSNWKTISTAVELGYKVDGKSWGQVLGESVTLKNANAQGSTESIGPSRKKVGRKPTPAIDKAKKAAEALDKDQFIQFAAWVQTELAIRTAQAKPQAIKVVAPESAPV